MAKRFRVAGNKAAIWTGEGDTAPFDNPLGNLGRVKFHSDLNYIQIIDQRSFNVNFPARSNFQQVSQKYPLYQHGRGGYPFVLGKIIVGGHPVAFTGSVPVQINPSTTASGATKRPQGFARWISLGADNVWVYAFEYCVNYWSNSSTYTAYAAITVPITVMMTSEILQ